MSLIEYFPEPDRLYTNTIHRRYIEKRGKIRYLSDDDDNMTAEDELQVVHLKMTFTAPCHLSERLWTGLTLSDAVRLCEGAPAKYLWLLALSHGLEVTATSLKPCYSGTNLVEASGKTDILKKLVVLLNSLYKEGKMPFLAPSCKENNRVICHDDSEISSSPVFAMSDAELEAFLTTCCSDDFKCKNMPKTSRLYGDVCTCNWKQRFKQRTYKAGYPFRGILIAPYDLVVRTIITLQGKVKMSVMHVNGIEPRESWIRHHGTPHNMRQEPFTWKIGADRATASLYYNQFESYYLMHAYFGSACCVNSTW